MVNPETPPPLEANPHSDPATLHSYLNIPHSGPSKEVHEGILSLLVVGFWYPKGAACLPGPGEEN